MTPLVLVHGFMGGSEQWHLQRPLGARRDLITADLPGFGRNAHLDPINRIECFADWVLDRLSTQNIDRFDLLGHSMGGMIVQEMVRRAPDRINRLVLYGTGAVGDLPGRFEPIETSKSRARSDGAQATAKRITATWFLDGQAADAYPDCAEIAKQSSLEAILAGLDAMRAWSGVDNLGRISAETLIIWGDHDRTYDWLQIERLWREIPKSTLAVVPSCAHAVHSEAPHIFNLIVERFLDRQTQDA